VVVATAATVSSQGRAMQAKAEIKITIYVPRPMAPILELR
jgi:hypothetical protein